MVRKWTIKQFGNNWATANSMDECYKIVEEHMAENTSGDEFYYSIHTVYKDRDYACVYAVSHDLSITEDDDELYREVFEFKCDYVYIRD